MLLLSVMFVLLAAAVNPAQGQEIETTDNGVIMTCPGGRDGDVTWYKNKQKDDKVKLLTFSVPADQGTGIVEGEYSCEYEYTDEDGQTTRKKQMFYFTVKVCENCYELSGVIAWSIMLGDVLVTGLFILFIYICAARNSDGTPKKASNPRPVNPPRPPNPDYAALDPKKRSSNALYAGLNK